MHDSTDAGPHLGDAEFFGKLIDTTRPGLAAIPDAVARQDFGAARRLFAADLRHSLQPERFFRHQRIFRSSNIMRAHEDVADAAERILKLELISCGTPHQFSGQVDWFANPTFNQYKEWTWQLNRHSEWALLAEQYRATGDERFAAGFARLFASWVRQAIVPELAPGNATFAWRTIEAGIRMGGAWQWALHSFYRSPHFTDDLLVAWAKSIWEHGWRLRNFHWTHNWLIMEMNGLAQIAILYPQLREAAEWKAYAFERLVEELDKQVYPDGFQYELTTNYHQVNIRNYQAVWDICLAYDEPVPPSFAEVLERMHTVNVLLMMPDGRLPDLNDGAWLEVAPTMRRAVELYPARADFRWAYTKGADGEPPAGTSVAFADAGYFALRTSWQPDALWALFDGGPFGYAHQHEDKLNLLLHAYGRLLLTEGGNYAYDDSPMRRYVLSTRAHNTIRVDGCDQNRRLRFNPQAPLSHSTAEPHHFNVGFDIVQASYDEGYGPDGSIHAVHNRTVFLLKRPPAPLTPCLLVIDRVSGPAGHPYEYEALWHLNADSVKMDGAAHTVQTQDLAQANLAIFANALSGLTLEVVKGQEMPEWQGWCATLNNQQGHYTAIPTARYRWRATGSTRLVTLLYPLPAGAGCPIVAVEAAPDVMIYTLTLCLADGSFIKLDERNFPYAM